MRVTGLWLIICAIQELTFIEVVWTNFRLLHEFSDVNEQFNREFYFAVLRIGLELIPGILFITVTDKVIRLFTIGRLEEKHD